VYLGTDCYANVVAEAELKLRRLHEAPNAR
jgi:hypothetical protein